MDCIKEQVPLVCLNCGCVFEVTSNGYSLAMYDKDRSVRYVRQGKKLSCPDCKRKKLIFKGKSYGEFINRRTERNPEEVKGFFRTDQRRKEKVI
jgi:hypothetical protein